MAEDTIKHKKIVMDNCYLLAKYLMSKNRIELGIQLLKRGCEHDNSKFDSEEFRKLSQILKSRQCFTNAKEKLTQNEIKAIKYHWEHNRHHPEYHSSYDDMTELDILEMVCDWFARSLQYQTDFLPFIEERQRIRFRFSTRQYTKIHKYCVLISELYDLEHNKLVVSHVDELGNELINNNMQEGV